VKPFAAALHAAAFVVDRDQQAGRSEWIAAHRAPAAAGLVVARKQDHAADQRVLQDLALFGGDFGPATSIISGPQGAWDGFMAAR
jgi:hypothetical protein